MADTGQHSVKADTIYVVLQLIPAESSGDPERWDIVDSLVSARDGDQAIKKVAAATLRGGDQATYVAVPSRSWNLVTIKAQATVTLEAVKS